MSTFKEQWNFFATFINPHASATQITEIEAAFYAGAMAFHKMQIKSVENLSEEDAMAAMYAWENEFDEFAKNKIDELVAKKLKPKLDS